MIIMLFDIYMYRHLAFDSQDNLYIADTYNYVIRKMSKDGNVSTVLGIPGKWSVDDEGSIHFTNSLCVDEDDDMLYYVDSGHRVVLRCDLKSKENKIVAGTWNMPLLGSEERLFGNALTTLFE